MFNNGDFVKETNRSGVHVGRVIHAFDGGVSVFDACTGKKTVFIHPEPATEAEFNAHTSIPLNAVEVTETLIKPEMARLTPKAKTYRWSCLECGAKYNGRECPRCGGEDRILNSNKDHDPSYVGGASAERYTPGE